MLFWGELLSILDHHLHFFRKTCNQQTHIFSNESTNIGKHMFFYKVYEEIWEFMQITESAIHSYFKALFYSGDVRKAHQIKKSRFLVKNSVFLRLGLFSSCFIV